MIPQYLNQIITPRPSANVPEIPAQGVAGVALSVIIGGHDRGQVPQGRGPMLAHSPVFQATVRLRQKEESKCGVHMH